MSKSKRPYEIPPYLRRHLRHAVSRLGLSSGTVKGTQPLLGLGFRYADASGDSELVELVQQNAEIVVSTNDGKWGQLLNLPSPASLYDLDYTNYDALLAMIPAGVLKRHHTVFWSKNSYYPNPGGYDFSTVVKRLEQNSDYCNELFGNKYGSTFDYIDGWNEPILTNGGGLKTYGEGEAITVDEIGTSLGYISDNVAAGTKIGINDFKLEEKEAKFDSFFSLAQDLLSGGYPLHYCGWEMHLDCNNPPTEEDLYSRFMRVQDELGLEVLVTEADFRIFELSGDYKYREQTQEKVVRRLMAAARRAQIHSVGCWGATDRYSWLYTREPAETYPPYPSERPLPFDYNYNPKRLWRIMTGELR
jgi:GH35 family endo-1,4-beta-xylanase